jgi:hypothetical protein
MQSKYFGMFANVTEPRIANVPSKASADRINDIVFDFDDTLLPTTFLAARGLKYDSPTELTQPIQKELDIISTSVGHLLSSALEYGNVTILTNAETGWVQLAAQRFIPGVMHLLHRCKIVSARTCYERMYPNDPLKWKLSAFHEHYSAMFPLSEDGATLKYNLLSFGDSIVEREAFLVAAKSLSCSYRKSIKFAEQPTLEELCKQQELVTAHIADLSDFVGDLDLHLTITTADAESSSQKIEANNSSSLQFEMDQ